MSDEPELRQGTDDPEWVRHLQQMLEDADHTPGPIDGIFGPRTEAAVEAYQEAFALTVDGIVGPQTWGSLNANAAPTPAGEGGDSGDSGGSGGSGDVPEDVVAAGFPATFGEWTDEQKAAYFKGEPEVEVEGDSPEEIQVAAIGSDTSGDGDALA